MLMDGNVCPLVSKPDQQAKDNRKRDFLLNTERAFLFMWPLYATSETLAWPSLFSQTTSSPSLGRRLLSEQGKIP